MRTSDRGNALRHLNTLFRVGRTGGLTDAQLLEWFTSQQDETAELAFRALVERHGPMVLRVCRSCFARRVTMLMTRFRLRFWFC